jgi:hypothetical protein
VDATRRSTAFDTAACRVSPRTGLCTNPFARNPNLSNNSSNKSHTVALGTRVAGVVFQRALVLPPMNMHTLFALTIGSPLKSVDVWLETLIRLIAAC